LNHSRGAKCEAARLLGISRKTLWEKLKSHQIGSRED
jgi:DNA-binding NtrC family response regulator